MQQAGLIEEFTAATESPNGKKLRSPLYSFKVNGNWYKCGFDNPNVSQGDNVEFSYENTQYGDEVTKGSVRKLAAGEAPAVAANAPQHMTPDARQLSIIYQSSRKDAIQILSLAVERELVKLPKASGYDTFLSLVDDLTVELSKKAVNPVLEAEPVVEVTDDE